MRLFCRSVTSLGAMIWALSSAPSLADDYLHLDKQYHTKCIGLYETPVLDGHYVYHSQGVPKNNSFTKLDVLSGVCGNAGTLPSAEFQPRAVSADYIFAADGIYNRHSVYRKSDWKRFGSLRLKDPVAASVIDGDTLYLVQIALPPVRKTYLTAFSLPDLKQKKTEDLNFPGVRVLVFGHFFLLNDDEHLMTYDYQTGEVRRAGFAMSSKEGTVKLPDGLTASIGCGVDARPLDDKSAMLHSSCHSYAVVDLATLKPRYDITLANGGILAHGYVAGELLYLFAQSTTAPTYTGGGEHDDIQIVDSQSGQKVASPPPLVSNNYTEVFQVEDRLIWAAFDTEASDFQVDVYRMQSHR